MAFQVSNRCVICGCKLNDPDCCSEKKLRSIESRRKGWDDERSCVRGHSVAERLSDGFASNSDDEIVHEWEEQ